MFHYCKWISWILSGNKVYIFDERKDQMYLLRGVGYSIWVLVEENRTLAQIKKTISEKYAETQFDIVSSDIEEFLSKLVEKEILCCE